MREPPTLPWSEVEALARTPTCVVWGTARARSTLAWPDATWVESAAPRAGVKDVIAIGGGMHLDAVKRAWRGIGASRLVAVPTVWGSGAEASPIAVWTEGGEKRFALDEALRPQAMAFYDGFAGSLSDAQVRAACGDTWAHAVEGFLSPLASAGLRVELSALMRDLLALPVAADARWFPLSARAAAGQAESSVGLVHGLAHVLEPRVEGLGHAALCATFLAPVLRFNARASAKWTDLTSEYGLDADAILRVADGLSTAEARRALAPRVRECWRLILRDASTRTNSTLVRPADVDAFVALLEAP